MQPVKRGIFFLIFFLWLFASSKLSLGNSGDTIRCNQYLEMARNSLNNPEVATLYIDSCIAIAKGSGNNIFLARAYLLLGNILIRNDEYPTALKHLLEGLNLAVNQNDVLLTSKLYNSIGLAYYFQNPEYFSQAIEYHKKAIEIQSRLNDSISLDRSYVFLGNIYGDPISSTTYNPDEALNYYLKALAIQEKLGDKDRLGRILGHIGFIYISQGKLDEAHEILTRSLSIFEELADRKGLMVTYYRLGALKRQLGRYQESADFLVRVIEMANEFNDKDLANNAHESLSNTYTRMGNYKKALHHYRQSVEIKFELHSIERLNSITEFEKKYETAQKEKEIEILKRESELTEIRMKKQQTVTFSIIGGSLLLILVIVLLYRSNALKNRANTILLQKNAEISLQKEEIEAQRDEIEGQRDLVVKQRDAIEKVNNQTIESLRYAQSIQAALLPSEKVLQQISRDYFVLMKPCELVSGDFFWATTFDEFQVFCVTDCTGHGVPGAFMSILGITSLNDIVAKHRITRPSEILGHLRQSVVEALSQNDSSETHKDGMDIALCVFNIKTRELQFAGAGIPLWLVFEKNTINVEEYYEKIDREDFVFCEVKGDIMPVGRSPRMKPFSNHTFALKNSSLSLYIATDGFADQVGQGGKYGNQRLKSFILRNTTKSFDYQKNLLSEEFENWMEEKYQIDDYTILGIKI